MIMRIKCRKLRWAGLLARIDEGRSVFKTLTGKPTGKRAPERKRRGWDDNFRINIK